MAFAEHLELLHCQFRQMKQKSRLCGFKCGFRHRKEIISIGYMTVVEQCFPACVFCLIRNLAKPAIGATAAKAGFVPQTVSSPSARLRARSERQV